MPCQVWLPYYIPPTVFPSHKKPNLQKLFSIPKSKHITLHPLCPATSTEPPPHPTCGEHDGEVLGLGFFFFFTRFPFLFSLLEFIQAYHTSSPLPSHADWAPTSSNSQRTRRRSFGLGFFFFSFLFSFSLGFHSFFFSSQVRRDCHRCRCWCCCCCCCGCGGFQSF